MINQAIMEVTDAAKSQILLTLKQYEEMNFVPGKIRIIARQNGCAAVSCELEIVTKTKKSDTKLQQDGYTIYIDETALMWAIGTKLDYIKDDCDERFVFSKPNVNMCHCGKSFTNSNSRYNETLYSQD